MPRLHLGKGLETQARAEHYTIATMTERGHHLCGSRGGGCRYARTALGGHNGAGYAARDRVRRQHDRGGRQQTATKTTDRARRTLYGEAARSGCRYAALFRE